MQKRVISAKKAAKLIKPNQLVLSGGFGVTGVPISIIKELQHLDTKDLKIVTTNCGHDEYGVSLLFKNNQVKEITASFIGGGNINFEKSYK